MDGGDVWSVAACGGAGGVPPDNRIFNRTMLRFRPIAPKPVAGGSVPGGLPQANQVKTSIPGMRAKRKYVRVRRNSGCMRKNSKSSKKSEGRKGAVVTLQLMPEKVEPKKASLAGVSWCKNVDLDLTVEKIEILDNRKPPSATAKEETGKVSDQAPGVGVGLVESWLTVESVTDTCMDERGLGYTDVEKVKNLETDTCPGFISDGLWKVRWVNEAYKRMVTMSKDSGEGKASPEVVVWLKAKDDNAVGCYSYPAFTCGVRLQYTWQNEKCTKTVPCDVWRLDCGGFAWRLDVKAALSLGL